MLGDRNCVAGRGIDHDHASARGSGDIDVVDACACAAHYLQTCARLEDGFGHLRTTAHNETIIVPDGLDQLLRVKPQPQIGLAIGLQLLATSVHYYRCHQERSQVGEELARELPYRFPLARQAAYLPDVLASTLTGGETNADLPQGLQSMDVLNYWWALGYSHGIPQAAILFVMLTALALAALSVRQLALAASAK